MMSETPITPGHFNLSALPGLLGKVDPVIFAIGCNDGSHTVHFLRLFPLSRVFAFEPDPRAIENFKASINGDRVRLFEIAISDRDGVTEFNASDGDPGESDWMKSRPDGWDLSGSIRKPKEHLSEFPWCKFDRTFPVQTRSLDSWSDENGIESVDFIWADVQGAERDLIEGGKRTLSRTRYFYTEYSDTELYEGQVGLDWIMKELPDFEVLVRFSDDVLLRNTRLSGDHSSPKAETRPVGRVLGGNPTRWEGAHTTSHQRQKPDPLGGCSRLPEPNWHQRRKPDLLGGCYKLFDKMIGTKGGNPTRWEGVLDYSAT